MSHKAKKILLDIVILFIMMFWAVFIIMVARSRDQKESYQAPDWEKSTTLHPAKRERAKILHDVTAGDSVEQVDKRYYFDY